MSSLLIAINLKSLLIPVFRPFYDILLGLLKNIIGHIDEVMILLYAKDSTIGRDHLVVESANSTVFEVTRMTSAKHISFIIFDGPFPSAYQVHGALDGIYSTEKANPISNFISGSDIETEGRPSELF